MTFPFGESVTLHQRGPATGADDFGDETFTPTDSVVLGAFAPGGSTEADDDGVVDQPYVLLPPDVQLTALDAVTVRGQTFEVDGAPRVWTNPLTGWRAGVQVLLVARETG